jgi:hypothetical protein
MKMNRITGKAAVAGALGAIVLGFGAGAAGAAPGPGMPPGPGPGPHIVGGSGHGHPLPPGQVKKFCPWQSPPGHWVGGPHGVPCT